jgi:hypothetical protein
MRIEVGLGLNGQIRDFLGRIQLRDPSLRWHEGRGWISRVYEIRGSEESLRQVCRALSDFHTRTAAIL